MSPELSSAPVPVVYWPSRGHRPGYVCVCVCVTLCHMHVALCHSCVTQQWLCVTRVQGVGLGTRKPHFLLCSVGQGTSRPPRVAGEHLSPTLAFSLVSLLLKYSNDFRCGVGEGEAEIPSGDERAADNGAAKSLALPLSAQPHQTRHGTAWNDITRHSTASPKPQDEAPQSFQDVLPQHQGKGVPQACKRDLETLGCPCLVPTPTP